MTGLPVGGMEPCCRAIACLRRELDGGVAQVLPVARIPFFFMPLTGTVSMAGGASTTTGADMLMMVRNAEPQRRLSVWAKEVDGRGARKV